MPEVTPRQGDSGYNRRHILQPHRSTMNLYSKLQQRAADNKPIRVGLIGAGKFGSMYLAQAPRMPGVHLVAIADLSPDTARANLARVGWKPEQAQAASADEALKTAPPG